MNSLTTYDVLGNERHKAICKLREMPKLYPNKDGGADLYAWKRDLANAIGADTELFSAIRDRLVYLLGGDTPNLSDLLKEDADAVDARPSDAASADSPVHGAVGCDSDNDGGVRAEGLESITQELRNSTSVYCKFNVELDADTFGRLCDEIDATHANLERDYATACRVNERQDLKYIDLAKRYDNTISLPFDKDGKVWRIGDELLDDGMVCEVVGIGPNRLYYYCDATGTVEWTQADSRRHYERKLAVGDVLDEMLQRFSEDSYEGGLTDFIAEYAAKLKLSDADA